jgi:hypothetical protein
VRRKRKKVLDEPKRKRINKGMKTKVSFKDILASVRKTGGRASTVFVPKKQKAKSDRNSWKRELE